ncbi:MAG: SufD family Fe-S cluster assembly protein, partial [Bacteroidota bacterium]
TTSPPSHPPKVGLWTTNLPGYHIHLYNGRLQPLPTLPKGVTLCHFSDMDKRARGIAVERVGEHRGSRKDPFVALNTGSFQEGCYVALGRGVVLDKPIYVHDYTLIDVPTLRSPRFFIHLGEESSGEVVYIPYTPNGVPSLENGVSEIYLDRGARLDYYMLPIVSSEGAYRLHYTQITQGAKSICRAYTTGLAGAFTRYHLGVDLMGEGSRVMVYGHYIGDGEQHMEHHVQVVHGVPHTTGHTHIRGVLGGRSVGVFNGLITVLPQAQKTVASQYHHGWGATPRTHFYTRPQLCIEADDVVCQHGATIAQMEEEVLFYLNTRGISSGKAKEMWVRAFLEMVTIHIPSSELRRYIADALEAKCRVLL